MKKKFYLLLVSAMVAFAVTVNAQLPTGFTNIDINNIDAGISSTNDLFWDFSNAKFEVPKGSGLHSIFSGGMWIGGLDNGGIAHMASQTYRQTGNDFWPGPIDTMMGVATDWNLWDRSWKLNKTEVLDHIQNYSNSGYVVPQNIAEWPGYDAALGRVLAPFADYNSNGIYDPANGDYPYILGDQTVYSIYNDLYTHSESTCDSLGVEVHRTLFGFDAPNDTALNNTIFSRYEIKNFSNTDYHDVYISTWIDFDLGNATDDYIGTDINLNMIYAYNGDNNDETSMGYGLNPPAIGVYFLNDSLTSSMSYDNISNAVTGNPAFCLDFMNYSRSIWLDNQPLTYGGDGRNPGNPVTTHIYPGVTNPIYFQAFGPWDEANSGNAPGDRRMIGSIGPLNLNAGDYKSFDIGYTWARATSGGPLASVAALQNAVSGLRVMYNNGVLTSIPVIPTTEASLITVFPNPASDEITIQNSNTDKQYKIKIEDAVGRIVYQKTNINENKYSIDVRDFSKGLYIVTVVKSGISYNKKLILK
ncbi:MAG: T9SS type A sorting domain-containing protein [Bacteroidetes bacterium]|nr:T9SS type A sorting domain-containing protein [Bacteroidota bacterium]